MKTIRISKQELGRISHSLTEAGENEEMRSAILTAQAKRLGVDAKALTTLLRDLPPPPKTVEETKTETVELEIPKVTLGVIAKRVGEMRKAGDTEEEIAISLKNDCRRYNCSLQSLLDKCAPVIEKGGETRKCDNRTLHYGVIATKAHESLRFDNTLLTAKLDSVEFNQENFDTLLSLLQRGQTAKREFCDSLHTTEWTSGTFQGYACMLHSPSYNLHTDKEIKHSLLYLHIGGWTDKTRGYNQYGCRMTPSGEASFHREESFKTPSPWKLKLTSDKSKPETPVQES